MTLHLSFPRFLCLLGLCAWFLLHAGTPAMQDSARAQTKTNAPIVHFTDVAQKAGLVAPVIFGGENTKKYIIETTGTGVAILDYDNDGWPDIFVVCGSNLNLLPSDNQATSHLDRNDVDGTLLDDAGRARLT